MLMCARKETGEKKHEQLYQRYNLAAGYSFLQIDLSNDGHMACSWELTSQKLLQEFDYYIEVVMDFAGYEFDKLDGGQESAFEKIKASIDRKIPVLMQLKKECQWVLVTGYDEEGTLYGLMALRGIGEPRPQSLPVMRVSFLCCPIGLTSLPMPLFWAKEKNRG